jgi:hypothetical protein
LISARRGPKPLLAKRSPPTWIRNAAAVVSSRHGAVTRQFEAAGCRRETVDQHARKPGPQLTTEPAAKAEAELAAENRRLPQGIAELEANGTRRNKPPTPA